MQTNTTIIIRLNEEHVESGSSLDSDSSDSDYTPHAVQALIDKAVSAATKDFESQLKIQQTMNAELTAKLQSITDNTENSINAIREEAKQERLHIQAQGQATQLQRYYEQRTSIMADIELLDCEAEESVAAGQPTPRTLVVKHRQLHSQLTKLLEQISITRTCLLNMCQQLHVDISIYINEE